MLAGSLVPIGGVVVSERLTNQAVPVRQPASRTRTGRGDGASCTRRATCITPRQDLRGPRECWKLGDSPRFCHQHPLSSHDAIVKHGETSSRSPFKRVRVVEIDDPGIWWRAPPRGLRPPPGRDQTGFTAGVWLRPKAALGGQGRVGLGGVACYPGPLGQPAMQMLHWLPDTWLDDATRPVLCCVTLLVS